MFQDKKVLVTGGAGLIGSALRTVLTPYNALFVVRTSSVANSDILVADINAKTGWEGAFINVNIVVHCAARVHIMGDSSIDPLSDFREVNVEGTANLARQAAEAGVKRFVFLSSIKVNGECSGGLTSSLSPQGKPFAFDDKPAPNDPYGVSKFEAEEVLKKICNETGMEYVIIRPPLVYGPGVKANFRSLLKWVLRGVPLPLGGVKNNKRSLVFVDNLVDLIRVCIDHPSAANQTFLVSDGEDVSSRELVKRVAKALGVEGRLLSIPPRFLGFVGSLSGKKDFEQRLCSSLQANISHTQNTLNWRPPYSMEEGLKQTADWYKKAKAEQRL